MKLKHFFNKTSIRVFCHKKTTINKARISNNALFNHSAVETGRSMVEILGVLAVIGVLSIGGIMGYRFAMDKYQANDIVNEVNLRSTDIWNRYQEMPLPDPSEDPDLSDFPEYAELTATGFPIDVTSHPDVAFRVHVFDVPSGVCKQVLNMPLINVIKGLQYIQVNDIKYEDTTQICGTDQTDNVMVFTSFLDSENDMGNGNHCIEDSECTSACGVPACDEETMTCTDGCTGNTDGKNICLQSTGQCVECIVNEDCKSKGEGYICSETTYTCEKMQKTCPDGTFRTRNGACVACDNGSNFFVYKNGEAYPGSSDEVDGYTMCQACDPTRKFGESLDDPTIGYCSFMCTMGVSFQTKDGRCISCVDQGKYVISDESISKEQCAACPGREWYSATQIYYSGGHGVDCQPKVECAADEFAYKETASYYSCAKCSDFRNSHAYMDDLYWGSSDPNFKQYIIDKCNNCPEYDSEGKYAARFVYENTCFPVCKQPENAEEQIEICKANPVDDRCTRQWQKANGSCLPCGANTRESGVKLDNKIVPALKELCEACGRRVNDKGFCVPTNANACEPGTFMASDGTCHACDERPMVSIESDELSGCTTNCRQNESGEYTVNGTIETRWAAESNTFTLLLSPNPAGTYCIPKCTENYINWYTGACRSCGDEKSLDSFTPLHLSDCDKCSNREVYDGLNCSPKCPMGYFKNRDGTCVLCSAENQGSTQGSHDQQEGTSGRIEGVALCEACGNRMIVGDNYCRKVNPGVSAICNSIDNNPLPAQLDEDLRRKAQPYLKGTYDGKLVRDRQDLCYSCEYNGTLDTTQEQCNSCQNRRYENGRCLKGLCEEGHQFLNVSGSCVACLNKNVAINPRKENLCGSCVNRRQLETGSSEVGNWAAKCVETCAGAQWQDATGKCMLCGEGGDREIGTDAESRRLCNQCENREVVEKTDTDGHIIGYRCEVIE